MSAASFELQPYPDPRRGKYCTKHKCQTCHLPADWVGKENGVSSYFCVLHIADWEEERGIPLSAKKVAA